MKKTSLVLLLSACSPVYAELPPVIDNSLYPPSAAPTNSANTASTTAQYELMGRVEQLQAEVQQLTGKVDEQAYRIDELKKHQTTMYSDFDERLQNMENKANGVAANPVDTGGAVNAGAKAAESPGAAAAAAPAPVSEAPAPIDKPVDNQAAKPKPAPITAPADKPVDNQAPKPNTEQVSNPEKQEYFQAYDELRNGRTAQSIEQFKAYLGKYPAGELANNAQYWLGEAYRANHDSEAARKAFNDVITKYPDGAKVPDAILKLGYIEAELKDLVKAREYLNRVIAEYPKSPAAALAAKKLPKLDEVKN